MAYEKMACLYETVDDLMNRLNNTICRYKETPVYVQVQSVGKLNLYDPFEVKNSRKAEIIKSISPKDPDFDISSIELGYVNWTPVRGSILGDGKKIGTNYVNYLSRSPVRRYRQGLSSDVVYSYKFDGGSPVGSDPILFSKGFTASALNIYPSLSEVLQLLRQNIEDQIAVSKEFCLSRTESGLTMIYHRCINIGYIEPGSREIKIPQGELTWVYRRLLDQLHSLEG